MRTVFHKHRVSCAKYNSSLALARHSTYALDNKATFTHHSTYAQTLEKHTTASTSQHMGPALLKPITKRSTWTPHERGKVHQRSTITPTCTLHTT
jgi:hypothetical protein